MSTLATMFATFVAFVSGVIFVTDAINRLFKTESANAKLIVSWVVSIVLAIVGFVLQLGFFADCGTPDMWQGWVKTILIGLGSGLCANKIYDREEIWRLLEWIFSFFKKDGRIIRMKLKEKH